MRLKTRQLEVAVALNRARSVTAAGRRLRLSQPAVSHSLAELEKLCGQRLFDRDPRGVTPTTAGVRFVQAAERILRQLEALEREMDEFAQGVRGRLRLCTECYTGYSWLPGVLASLRRRHPDYDLEIVPEAARAPSDWLRRRELDLAIVHDLEVAPDLATEALFQDELVALVAPDHPWSGRTSVDPEGFNDQELFLHFDPRGSAVVRDFLEPHGVTPRKVTELQLTEAVLAAVRAGLGVTVAARWVVRREIEEGSIVPLRLGGRGLFRRWSAMWLADDDENEVRRELVERLKSLKP